MDKLALAVSKKYTDETVVGGGAIKGKNCTIESIEDVAGGHKINFKWTLDDGTELTDSMTVLNGTNGVDGVTPSFSIGTVEDGDEADVTLSGTDDFPILNFVLPKGDKGDTGKGLKSLSITAQGHVIVTYTDDTTQDIGIIDVSQLPVLDKVIVQELPSTDINPNAIYLMLHSDSETDNYYDEYMYINNAWEKLGSTKTSLNYVYKNSKTFAISGFDDSTKFDLTVEYRLDSSQWTNTFHLRNMSFGETRLVYYANTVPLILFRLDERSSNQSITVKVYGPSGLDVELASLTATIAPVYQTVTDSTLKTNSKKVVGAINELYSGKETKSNIKTATLVAGETTVTFTVPEYGTHTYDVYTDKVNLDYESLDDSVAARLTVEFEAQSTDTVVYLVIREVS